MAAQHWPSFMVEPEYAREMAEHERLLCEEWEEAQENALIQSAALFEEGSPA